MKKPILPIARPRISLREPRFAGRYARIKISTLKNLNDPFDLFGYELTTRGKKKAMSTYCDKFHQRFGRHQLDGRSVLK
ncbi:hypothetical protein [Cupriavidus sp. 2SB]|uniref:hypothetical protein n=1 Tax=Cupriavidus sp. 2SB TaxID=2502199 RepID=UPI0010F8345A|nr:hypothetical protein [Cupriavidus sp. 2SB]